MNRILAVAAVVALVVVALVAMVHFGGHAPEGTVPDPALPIHLADGRVLPLYQVLELAESRRPAPVDESGSLATSKPVRTRDEELFALAKNALWAGRTDEARALFLSLDTSALSARDQRYVGWDVMTKRLGDARRGVPYVEAALWREPLNGNCWQDFGRVYGHVLGFEID